MSRGLETTPEILKRLLLPAVFVGILFWALWERAPVPEEVPEPLVFQGETMGTTYTVKAIGSDIDEQEVTQVIDETLEEIDVLMSNWRDDSEISRFNASGTEPFPLSLPTIEVMELAGGVHEATVGAFDVTVAPLVEAWGFGPTGTRPAPSQEALVLLMDQVGFDKLALASGALRKVDPSVSVDLSAIAKGYGVDQVAQAVVGLESVQSVMVEIGGEIRVIGPNADGGPWHLAIEQPDQGRRTVHSVLALESGALATSGDYRRYIDEQGQRRTHVIDPRTGRPVSHGVASASVVARDCATADAWATALMVLEPEAGQRLIEKDPDLQAMWVIREGDAFKVQMSSGFSGLLVD